MGVTKNQEYSQEIITLSAIAKALGHPARLAIVEYLAATPGCITNDIVNELPISQPTVSQHLRELRSAGIIRGEIEGTAICYCLNQNVLDSIQTYFKSLAEKSKNFNCC